MDVDIGASLGLYLVIPVVVVVLVAVIWRGRPHRQRPVQFATMVQR